jgi:DNA-binding transcriptional LysR family regulator
MKPRPDLQALEAFAAVARCRSFRRAAVERGISASALSHALRSLEERVGVRLLNRTTRSVTPTEAGYQLLTRLEPALQEVENALAELSAQQGVLVGTLRLNVPRPAARLVLAPILTDFIARYPRIKVEVATDDALSDIVGQGFDAGIRFGESLGGDMVALQIGPPQRFVSVAAPSYLADHGIPSEPRDLLNHACIGRRFPSGAHYNWEYQGLRIEVAAALTFDDDAVMIQTARDGAGLAYVYESMVREDVAQGRLVTVLDAWSSPPSPFFLYFPSRRHMPSILRALVDFVRSQDVPLRDLD